MKVMLNTLRKRKKNLITVINSVGCFIIILVSFSQSLQAQAEIEINKIQLMDAAPNYEFSPFPYDFTTTDIKDFFNLKNNGKYPSVNLFDGDFNTCWVAGSSKWDKNPILYIKIPTNIDIEEVILNIFPGYGKREQLYFQNCRPKKIKISILSALYPEGYSTEVTSLYLTQKFPLEKEIELSDIFAVQSFQLDLDKQSLLNFQRDFLLQYKSSIPSFILQLEVTDVYLGTKYDDICISELFFNDRFITPCSDIYNEIKNVYIQNDTTLLVDYVDKKGVIIYKDPSCVFTMVDWPEGSYWAILYFVPNNEVEEGSRILEQYSLIDLKNGKVVDAELEKCTGVSPMFQIIEKYENGKTFINNDGNYRVELR